MNVDVIALNFLLSLNNLSEFVNNKADIVSFNSHVHQTTLNEATIIAYNKNRNQFCFVESLLNERYKPELNYGIKAAKELVLFSFQVYCAACATTNTRHHFGHFFDIITFHKFDV